MIRLSTNYSHYTDSIGFLGLWLFSFSAFLSTAAAGIGYVLFALGFLFAIRAWRQLLREPLVIASLGLMGYIVIRTYLAQAQIPEIAADMWFAAADWGKLLLFIPFAYWLGRRPEWAGWLLLAALTGFVAGMLLQVDWHDLPEFLLQRAGFQFPAIGFGLISGGMLLGLLLLGWRAWEQDWLPGIFGRIIGFLAWGLAILVITQGFIQTQSRGSWLALAVTIMALLVHQLAQRIQQRMVHKQVSLMLLLAVLLISLLSLYQFNREVIHQRFQAETDVIGDVLAGTRNAEQLSSINLRINAWDLGVDLIAGAPLWGYGPGSSRHLIANSGRTTQLFLGGEWLPHLHSTYIEIPVQLGAVGLLWTLLILFLLIAAARGSCCEGAIRWRYCRFLLAVLLFTAIWALFDYRLLHRDWRFAWILLAGLAYSYRLRAQGIAMAPGPRATAAP